MAKYRPEEKYAFNVVGRVLGVEVEPFDIEGRQGAVDALLHYLDGRCAALEVSSIGPQDEARILNFLDSNGIRRDIVGLTQLWSVYLPKTFRPRDLPSIDAALLECERSGFGSLSQGLFDEKLRDLLILGVSADVITMPQPVADPRAYVQVRGVGGGGGEGIQPLPGELAEHLRAPGMRENIEKLAASGFAERHLFLMVRPSAFSFPVYDELSSDGTLPAEPPQLPEGLSEVWLASERIEGGVVRATARGEWHRVAVEESDQVSPKSAK